MYNRLSKLISSLVIVLVAGVGVYAYKQAKAPSHLVGTGFFESLSDQEGITENYPEPFRKLEDLLPSKKGSILTVPDIIRLTNAERLKLNRAKLKENKLLSESARLKLEDMFKRQYFEHISPDHKGPSDIIKSTGYSYIMVGENLAEGNFKSTEELLLGWMNSPGHRANIINAKYTEIGVAVREGMFQGRKVWMAVQEFGRPLTDCPAVNTSLKDNIQISEARVKNLQDTLANLNQQMQTAKAEGNVDLYNSLVPQYNSLIVEVNELVSQIKDLVSKYNSQVESFNACLK